MPGKLEGTSYPQIFCRSCWWGSGAVGVILSPYNAEEIEPRPLWYGCNCWVQPYLKLNSPRTLMWTEPIKSPLYFSSRWAWVLFLLCPKEAYNWHDGDAEMLGKCWMGREEKGETRWPLRALPARDALTWALKGLNWWLFKGQKTRTAMQCPSIPRLQFPFRGHFLVH